jgi:hypothetical protein
VAGMPRSAHKTRITLYTQASVLKVTTLLTTLACICISSNTTSLILNLSINSLTCCFIYINLFSTGVPEDKEILPYSKILPLSKMAQPVTKLL